MPNYKYHTFDCGCEDGYVGDLCEVFGKFPMKGCQRTYEDLLDRLALYNSNNVMKFDLDVDAF